MPNQNTIKNIDDNSFFNQCTIKHLSIHLINRFIFYKNLVCLMFIKISIYLENVVITRYT